MEPGRGGGVKTIPGKEPLGQGWSQAGEVKTVPGKEPIGQVRTWNL